VATKPATFDPLDAALFDGHKIFQSMPDSLRAPHYVHRFWVDPAHWKRHKPPDWVFALKWTAYRYAKIDTAAKLRAIATRNVPGIYVFSVKPGTRVIGFPLYALYVGISNATDSGRPVRKRLEDYLPSNISSIKKRKLVHRMICLYFDSLWVHFAYVNRPSSVLRKTEEQLHGYLAPPFAVAAYPVDMKSPRKAFKI
jgi:hypothetical protein